MIEDLKDQESQTEPAAPEAATEAEAPQAGAEATEQAPQAAPSPEELAKEVEALRRELKRVREEAAKYRVKAKQTAQEAEKAKTLEEQVAELMQRFEEAERRARLAEIKADLMPSLGGDLKRVEAALALAERDGLLTEEGVDVDTLLERYPFLRPQAAPTDVGANPPGTRPISLEDLKHMSPEEINAKWEAIRAALKRKGGKA